MRLPILMERRAFSVFFLTIPGRIDTEAAASYRDVIRN
jgi:hypothetical protein